MSHLFTLGASVLEGVKAPYWTDGVVPNLLILGALLLVAALARRLLPLLSRWAIPDSVIAGGLAFFLGPSVFKLLPIDQKMMESLAYHGLALAFIAVSLQTPNKSRKAAGAVSIIFGIPILAAMQGILGLLLVLGFSAMAGDPMHPGMGILLPLGFSQGPGQALSLGTQWEQANGLVSGGQVGLIMAALGFAWCCVVGVPLVGIARRRGWIDAKAAQGEASALKEEVPSLPPLGGQEPLMLTVAAICLVYLLTFGVLLGLDRLLVNMPNQQRTIWGFHFVLGGLMAIPLRGVLGKLTPEGKLNDVFLGRLAGLVVDVTTTAAIAAIQLAVLQAFLVPILVMTTVAGVATLLASLWLARRAFPEAPFEHALVLFGTSTGTLPTGLTLLRILDPELRGPVAMNTVLGSSAALLPGLPLLVVMMPWAITRWPDGFPGAVWVNIALMAGYLVFLLVLWRYIGPLRARGPLLSLWPPKGADEP